MNIENALYEFVKAEIVPMIAGNSEFAAALLNGALRSARKKFTFNLDNNTVLQTLGLVGENGKINEENLKEFAAGMFENKDVVRLPLQQLGSAFFGKDFDFEKLETVIALAGGDEEFFKGDLKFSRSDFDRFLQILQK